MKKAASTEMIAVGAYHSGSPGTIRPVHQRRAMRILRKYGAREQIGFELLKERGEYDSKDEKDVFWQALHDKVKKAGGTPVNLEPGPYFSLKLLNRALLNAVFTPAQPYLLKLAILEETKKTGDELAQKLAEKLLKNRQSITAEEHATITLALIFARSLWMHQNAKEKLLKKIVVGSLHAEDLASIGLARAKYTRKNFKKSSLYGNAYIRADAYQQNEKLIEELRKYAISQYHA